MKKKLSRKHARRTAQRITGEAQHVGVVDSLTALLAQAHEKLGWDERTRVVVLVSTNHETRHELFGMFATASGHMHCIVSKALDVLETPYTPPPFIVTRH